jgi:hypothetical protein
VETSVFGESANLPGVGRVFPDVETSVFGESANLPGVGRVFPHATRPSGVQVRVDIVLIPRECGRRLNAGRRVVDPYTGNRVWAFASVNFLGKLGGGTPSSDRKSVKG